MRLAVGDVVRVRATKELGDVRIIARGEGPDSTASLIGVKFGNGRPSLHFRPEDIEVVTKARFRITTGPRALVAFLGFALGISAAYGVLDYVQDHGARNDWVLALVTVSVMEYVVSLSMRLLNPVRKKV